MKPYHFFLDKTYKIRLNTIYGFYKIVYGIYMICIKNKNTVPAIDRAIDVIEIISSCKKNMSLSEIMDYVNIPRQSLSVFSIPFVTGGFSTGPA